MEYYVSKSFKDYIYDIAKAYKNDANKLVVDAKNKCNRCNGSGLAISHIENGKPIPYLNDNGICYTCEGKGFLFKTIRLYTEKEFNSIERQNKKIEEKRMQEAEQREQEKRALAANEKNAWLLENGFNEEENTFVYIAEDSYDRKEELKNAGWRYHPLIGWHYKEVNVPHQESDIYLLNVNDAAEFNMYGEGTWKYSVKNIIAEAKDSLKLQSRSEWIGLEKEKIIDLPVVLKRKSGYNSRFGWVNIFTFTNNENVITWFTSTAPDIQEGKTYKLNATIKGYNEYKGEKQTIVNRARLEVI